MAVTVWDGLDRDKLNGIYHSLLNEYEGFRARKLNLDMSRGRPSKAQLNISSGLLDCLSGGDYTAENGLDCRNYGGLDGIPEIKRIVAELMDADVSEVIIGGNSSLSMMFDNIASNVSHGVRDDIPWQKQGRVKFICPAPGYDRHFAICEYFHIEMTTVPMTPEGPDMDAVEELAENDAMIKGMWCVPVFSNPDGCVYSPDTVRRIARMKPRAHDFRLYWDNAYCIHNFEGERPVIPNIIRECERAGNPHMPLEFMSFSKISFPGGGISAVITSASNCGYILKRLSTQTIGPDKLNQLRHCRFFKNAEGVLSHMKKHSELIKPKFDATDEIFEKNLGDMGVGFWEKPRGGYFLSFRTLPGCAARVVALCGDAGVSLTKAGATYPYYKDPMDSSIRIAPTSLETEDVRTAAELFCLAVKIASLEKLID